MNLVLKIAPPVNLTRWGRRSWDAAVGRKVVVAVGQVGIGKARIREVWIPQGGPWAGLLLSIPRRLERKLSGVDRDQIGLLDRSGIKMHGVGELTTAPDLVAYRRDSMIGRQA